MTSVTSRHGGIMLRRVVPAVLALVLATAAPGAASTPAYGRTGERDGVLRHGCHPYRYHYVVTTPTQDWTLETFLVDPGGNRLASGAFSAQSDPEHGRSHWRICRTSTRPGRFTIRAKVTWYTNEPGPLGLPGTGTTKKHVAWFKPSHFRLRRAA